MEFVIVFGAAFALGSIITTIVSRARSIGTILIDSSDPHEGPYLFLKASKDVSFFQNKKYATVRLKQTNFLSQK